MLLLWLSLGFSLCVIKSFLTYQYRDASYFVWMTIPISVSMAFIWSYYAKISVGNTAMYWRAIIWDVSMMGAYNVLPLLAFGVKFNAMQGFGIALIFCGILIFKLPTLT